MFETTQQGIVNVIGGNEPLNVDTVDQLSVLLEECLAEGQPLAVLNLDRVPLIDSGGLETLVDVQENFQQRGGEIKLAAANGLCSDILRLTGVDDRFEVFGDVTDAVGSFVQ